MKKSNQDLSKKTQWLIGVIVLGLLSLFLVDGLVLAIFCWSILILAGLLFIRLLWYGITAFIALVYAIIFG